MVIKTKLDSDAKIISLGLNYSPFKVVYTKEDALSFVNELEEPVGIREKRTGGGQVIRQMTRQQMINFIKSEKMVQYPCAVYHDVTETDTKLIYQGEIFIDGTNGLIAGRLSYVKSVSLRAAMLRDDCFDIAFADMSNEIYHWDNRRCCMGLRRCKAIIDYCCRYNLIDCTVEFSYYSVLVGVNNENILIWELRNY